MKEYKALQTVRTYLILCLRGIYLITLLRFGWVVVLPALYSAVHILLFSRQPKLKGDSQRMRREGRGEAKRRVKEMGDVLCMCMRVHVCMRHPLDEFNHSHMKGHLSWPLETNLALSAINLTKWMPWEEINSVEMRQGMILLTINVTFTFIASPYCIPLVESVFSQKGLINIV